MQRIDPPLELWGGVECTINRVGDRFFSQLDRNGRHALLDDLDRFAKLGIRTLRFPILWEDLAPDSLDSVNWSTIDAQLGRLRELAIKPIAGLVHHGTGPRYTSLIDPEFPAKLAAFARRVATRYPWLDAFTPVNEPLTTARFSGLYGHWYPHGRDDFTFGLALLNQCRGVVLAMQAIREINPSAILVQTDDLGRTHSRPKLHYQADFENERRWLTWDLLCGRVTRDHPMWSFLVRSGLDPESVGLFEREPSCPDIVGVNYYITSERFLDDHISDYDQSGGNGRDRYADVAAVRVRREGMSGIEEILREASDRYGLPLAVTEAHLACTREEQLRWFKEIWDAGTKLRTEGRDIRAITAWALLGAFDWNSLLTRQDNYYESGAFDLRGGVPRPTAVATMIGQLAERGVFEHPVLETPGWWHRPLRLLANAACREETLEVACDECASGSGFVSPPPDWSDALAATARPILITGGGGRLAQGFAAAAQRRGLAYRALTRSELDIADAAAVARILHDVSPWAVINCAGFSGVEAAEQDEPACLRVNLQGAETLALACARTNTQLVTFSSDFVFDGAKAEGYFESDRAAPLNFYGESKLLAEISVRASVAQALVIRPGKVFAPSDASDFLHRHLEALGRGECIRVANNLRFSPTYLPDLVHTTLDLLIDNESGLWHLANDGAVTPEEFLFAAATKAQLDTRLIEGVPAWFLNRLALRPPNRSLRSERGQLMPDFLDALHRYLHECPPLPELDRALALP